MQVSREQLAEDHDHNVEVMAQTFQHSVRLREDLGTQETNSKFQESYDDAPPYFKHSVRLNEDLGTHETNSEDQESFHDAEEEEEFSFSFDGEITSPIAAEDAFLNGKIRPMFPLFNQDLLLQQRYFDKNLIVNPNVKKVLVEMNKRSLGNEISGPYCEWEPERERCKKSSSTGFSKLWRLKDLVVRSNSDGRDTFVFLNNRSNDRSTTMSSSDQNNRWTTTSSSDQKNDRSTTTSSSDQNATSYRRKDYENASSFRRKEDKKATKISGHGGEEVKRGGKKQTTSLSSHEVYLKKKAKENEGRKKSYMPYKPEVVGFFTNANGGSISKNVHPY